MQQTNTPHTQKFLRQRKVLLIMPLLVIPLLFLVFHGLGGGKGEASKNSGFVGRGLNMSLPEPQFGKNENALDKMGLYKRAEQDSARRRQRMKDDPYAVKSNDNATNTGSVVPGSLYPGIAKSPSPIPHGGLITGPVADSQAEKVMQRLEQLKLVMNQHQPVSGGVNEPGGNQVAGFPVGSQASPAMANLQRVMQAMKQQDTSSPDPQLDKLSGMLDKILRIQHPGEEGNADTVRPGIHSEGLLVNPSGKEAAIKTLAEDGFDAAGDEDLGGGFMDIDNPSGTDSVRQNLIGCVIDQDQSLIAGATVGLRLTQEAEISGFQIRKNSLLWGKVSVSGERFMVSVSSIRYQHTELPVSMEVYDQDGLPGIRIPGSISRDVTKESANEGLSSLGMTAMDPSVAGQATTAGIQVGKSLISRKVKLVRGAVSAGYQLFLKNTKSKN